MKTTLKPSQHISLMSKSSLILYMLCVSLLFLSTYPALPEADYTISKKELENKIKGGWAGQVIGVTYGGPTEFRYNGTIMQDYHPIEWNENQCIWWYENIPGLYDDVYMDLTFVEVFEEKGLDASASELAKAFAYADYPLWHANQAARSNILNGIMPPESGHWKNNPHADDIDFQIEADFAGLMSPGLVNQSSEICDKVGHIMNYGDGWYGGVFIAAMYSNAFIYTDLKKIIGESLSIIPKESQFYQCIEDVINWKAKYPNDWKQTWFEVQKKWSEDVGCPDGVFNAFNIDAKINAAYVVIGLLYGDYDYGKTLEISTRCGMDSDCNPASAGGILGTLIGYDKIPEYWKKPLYPVEDMKFEYTNWSLNDVYSVSYKHALEILRRNGAKIEKENITIPVTTPKQVVLEIGWENLTPVTSENQNVRLSSEIKEHSFSFNGSGFLLKGFAQNLNYGEKPDHVFEIELTVDGIVMEPIKMTTDALRRRLDIGWNYDLSPGKHEVKIVLKNPKEGYVLLVGDLITYKSKAS